ncbi:serine/threonine-protein kinase [Paracidovorax valerianellae]|uniref:non-specific serine/threonine protein kinase n=1 Tax=Paracidovorax valerianellae TaxID=187868 RepID=A0A1G7A355_9BURK|nr:serine/threonine-protein kinase [Paracidovorax valerianellae]MDA8443760.1 protein kinase [Paracidovorax valerianellae]SDE09334.1 Serine/threonine protein kinase [Paracidovorax valerianellae]
MHKEISGSANCLAPGVQVGEYRLSDVIGEGGFGIVYRARDLSLDRIVAIKEYMPSTLAGRKESNQIHVRSQHRGAFDAGLRSFINEARLLAKFSHPALVHVYRFFEANGTAYMVMQYYEGQTFRTFLNQQPKAMDEQWLSAIIAPILDVLEMLHAADCYHRDIAPDNIFLQSSGMPVLLDFGAARRIIGDMTQALTMVLKPGFAPIEQYVDDGAMPQGAWTDIYQLGALLYLSITGRPPATSVARMINDPVSTLVPETCPGFSARFLSGVHHALAIKPQDRPQSIGELRHLLGLKTVTLSWPSSGMMGLGPAEAPFPTQEFDTPGNVPAIPAIAPAASYAEAVPTALLPKPEPERGAPQRENLPPAPVAPAYQQDRVAPEARVAKDVQSAVPSQPSTSSVPRPESRPRKAKTAPVKREGAAQPAPLKRPAWVIPALGLAAFVLIAGGGWWFVSGKDAAKPEAVIPNSQELDQWALASRINTPDSLRTYLTLFPNGAHRAEAEGRLAGLTSPAVPASVPLAQQAPASVPLVVASAPAVMADVAPAKVPVVPALPASTPGLPMAVPPAEEPARALAQAARAADAENKGKIILRVMPWGNVSVDRVPAGTTPPLTQLTLTEGLHRIDISNPVAPTVTQMVLVKKGESVVLTHKFE